MQPKALVRMRHEEHCFGKRTHRFRCWLLLTVAPALAACSGSPATSADQTPPGEVVLVGAGSTFDAPLFERWFTAYHSIHPRTRVKYDAVGSGEGERRFIGLGLRPNEAVDFGASDSAMSDVELAVAEDPTLMVPATGGCVVVAYNLPGLKAPLKLSRRAYASIFLGDIQNWNDPRIARSNPGVPLPSAAIGRVVRLDNSGTTFAFSSHLAAISDQWRQREGVSTHINWLGDVINGKGNEGVAGQIRNFEDSIGYVGYEFAMKLGLSLASLENRDGHFVQPSPQSCAAGLATADLSDNLRAFVPDPRGTDSYPIVTFSWVLLRKTHGDAPKTAALRDLIEWCLKDGQQSAEELGYARLPSPVVDRALRAVSLMNDGK
jgi:phosphate transport system substrate-binding protein